MSARACLWFRRVCFWLHLWHLRSILAVGRRPSQRFALRRRNLHDSDLDAAGPERRHTLAFAELQQPGRQWAGGCGLESGGGLLDRTLNRTKHQDGNGGAVEVTIERPLLHGWQPPAPRERHVRCRQLGLLHRDCRLLAHHGVQHGSGNGPQYFSRRGQERSQIRVRRHHRFARGARRHRASLDVEQGVRPQRQQLHRQLQQRQRDLRSPMSFPGLRPISVHRATATKPSSTICTSRSDEDSYLGRIAGFDVSNRYRLENIQIKSNGTVVRKYRLTYDTSSATSRSRLTSAKECADDAEATAFCRSPSAIRRGRSDVGNVGRLGRPSAARSYPANTISTATARATCSSSRAAPGRCRSRRAPESARRRHRGFFIGHLSRATIPGEPPGRLARQCERHVELRRLYNGSSFVSTSTGMPVNSTTIYHRPQWRWHCGSRMGRAGSSGTVMLRLNTTAGAATVPSFASASTATSFSVGQGSVSIIDAQSCPIERKCDLNGDGRADLMVNVTRLPGAASADARIVDAKYDLLASGSWVQRSGYRTARSATPGSYLQ